jgi:hypothetical protein
MQLNLWRAGNSARSRLSAGSGRLKRRLRPRLAAPQSGGTGPICTRPQKLLWTGGQARLHWILLDISPDTIELRIGSDQTIEAFFLPKWSVCAQEKIGLVSSATFERAQPFSGKHVRSRQKMNVVRHHDESMQFIPVQFAVSMVQRRHHHLCNFRPAQKQGAIRACIQETVDGHERFACGDEYGWGKYTTAGKTAMQSESDEQGLLDYVPMGQPPFIMPHTSSWCINGGEILTPFRQPSRLKAGSNWRL